MLLRVHTHEYLSDNPGGKGGDGNLTHPKQSLIVVVTHQKYAERKEGDENKEFRIGIVSHEDFKGLGSLRLSGGLNKKLALLRFGDSKVFTDYDEATKTLRKEHPDINVGLKVLYFNEEFPEQKELLPA